MHVRIVEAQAPEHGPDLDFVGIATSVIERLLQAPIALQDLVRVGRVGEQSLQLAQAGLHVVQLGEHGTGNLPRRFTSTEVGVLAVPFARTAFTTSASRWSL